MAIIFQWQDCFSSPGLQSTVYHNLLLLRTVSPPRSLLFLSLSPSLSVFCSFCVKERDRETDACVNLSFPDARASLLLRSWLVRWIRKFPLSLDLSVAHTKVQKWIFTFSSEKVLDLCKMWPPPFLSNVHVLRSPFFGKTHGFYFNQKNVVKNKKLWFPAKQWKIRKNVKK